MSSSCSCTSQHYTNEPQRERNSPGLRSADLDSSVGQTLSTRPPRHLNFEAVAVLSGVRPPMRLRFTLECGSSSAQNTDDSERQVISGRLSDRSDRCGAAWLEIPVICAEIHRTGFAEKVRLTCAQNVVRTRVPSAQHGCHAKRAAAVRSLVSLPPDTELV